MQTVRVVDGEVIRKVELPHQDEEILPGIRWGSLDQVGTPAFWAAMAWNSPNAAHGFIVTSGTLAEEIGFCLLGGHGVTAELAGSAYEHLREAGVFNIDHLVSAERVEYLLTQPLQIGGRPIRYRFPRQRATRIAIAMREIADNPPAESDHVAFRKRLLDLPGIGPKTASWITRNWLGSDDVAILDIHVIRACLMMGVFDDPIRLPRDYNSLEERFLDFSRRLGIRPAILDAIIWKEMRDLPLDLLQVN